MPNINYGKLLDESMYVMVKNVLKTVEQHGLPGNHHFFISFITHHNGVQVSQRILSQYPKDMTIVLQHQFQNLSVTEDGFSVQLDFGGIAELLIIPFKSIIVFADPSVSFALQFKQHQYTEDNHVYTDVGKDITDTSYFEKKIDDPSSADNSKKTSHPNKIISFANYKKKRQKKK